MNTLPFRRRLPAVSTLNPQTDEAWCVYAHRAAYEGLQRPVLNAVRRAAYEDDYPELWADVTLGVFHRSLRLRQGVLAERVREKTGLHLFDYAGLRVLDELIRRPEHPAALRAGCILAFEAARTFIVHNDENHARTLWAHDGLFQEALTILDSPEREDPFLTAEDAGEALRVLGRRAAANLAYHPGDEQESGVVLLAFSLQRLAFAAHTLNTGVPWLALCDAWGELVVEQPLAPLGRPLNRLGRGSIVGLDSLWSVARPALRRDGMPEGRSQTLEGWCVFVVLMAGSSLGMGSAELALSLEDRLPEGEAVFSGSLVRQALQALARHQLLAASQLKLSLAERDAATLKMKPDGDSAGTTGDGRSFGAGESQRAKRSRRTANA